ncbi:hypothetical protein CRUP_012386 [Coryphaenoides rupestris]|nr:hypothetical protein CRUP_012386 [Coryphaenoides rupestris]
METSTKITPEVLREMLRFYNLSRREFIESYHIEPLVYVLRLPAGVQGAVVVLYALIFALALVGNSLVVYTVARKRSGAQTATDVFIGSLAVSDLLITFFCVPFTLLQNISSEWLGGVLVCKTVPFVQTTAIVTGILTMTCIAIERYQGIVYPLKRRQYMSRRAYKKLGIVWIASVMVGSPMLFVQQLQVKYDFLYDHYHVCCQESWPSRAQRQAYATFMMVALFLLPLLSMLLLYSRIAVELWLRKRVGDSSVLSTMNQREKKYAEATLNTVMAVAQAVGFFNSFNNPIVYAFMNENFKKSCLSTLSHCLRKPSVPSGRAPRPGAGGGAGGGGGGGGGPPPRPARVGGPDAHLSVHFRPLKRQAFLATAAAADEDSTDRNIGGGGGGGGVNGEQGRPPVASSHSRSDSPLGVAGDKAITLQSELPGSSIVTT